MVLGELIELLDQYLSGAITEMDLRLGLFMFPYSAEVEYIYHILDDTNEKIYKLFHYIHYLHELSYYTLLTNNDDSDDI